jgi:hypothetical protein
MQLVAVVPADIAVVGDMAHMAIAFVVQEVVGRVAVVEVAGTAGAVAV